MDKSQQVFLELLKAGLWEKEVYLSEFGEFDYAAIMRIAEEQCVVGLITAGLEQVRDVKIPQEWTLKFIGSTLLIEQRNKAMNGFVARLMELLRKNDIFAILVKGQGVAQCYEKPAWRASGDIDLLLNRENYTKAKEVLLPLALDYGDENESRLHLPLTIDNWIVELHGTMHGWLKKVDCVVDEVQDDVFRRGHIRPWVNDNIPVLLPREDEDVFFVFTHILQHFYTEGIGLRQICDWCRLLWVYRGTLNHALLESRIRKAGIITEWKAFASLAVDYLAMPEGAMHFYDSQFKDKGSRLICLILENGKYGYSREKGKNDHIVKKYLISFVIYSKMAVERLFVSPKNAVLSWWALLKVGGKAAVNKIKK